MDDKNVKQQTPDFKISIEEAGSPLSEIAQFADDYWLVSQIGVFSKTTSTTPGDTPVSSAPGDTPVSSAPGDTPVSTGPGGSASVVASGMGSVSSAPVDGGACRATDVPPACDVPVDPGCGSSDGGSSGCSGGSGDGGGSSDGGSGK